MNELTIIQRPEVREILSYMANINTINESGQAGSNQNETNAFDVRDQRRVWQVGALGVSGNVQSLIDRCILGCQYPFNYQLESGRYADSGISEHVGFLEALFRVFLIFQDDGRPETVELINLKDGARKALEWIVSDLSVDTEAKMAHFSRFSNGLAATATMFYLGGEILQERDQGIGLARKFYEPLLNSQHSSGYFPEEGGYDSSYQAVTLWHLEIFGMLQKDTILWNSLETALAAGWNWELSRIDKKTGQVLTEGNARTGPGKDKQLNYPEIIMAMRYRAVQTYDKGLMDLSEKVKNYALANK